MSNIKKIPRILKIFVSILRFCAYYCILGSWMWVISFNDEHGIYAFSDFYAMLFSVVPFLLVSIVVLLVFKKEKKDKISLRLLKKQTKVENAREIISLHLEKGSNWLAVWYAFAFAAFYSVANAWGESNISNRTGALCVICIILIVVFGHIIHIKRYKKQLQFRFLLETHKEYEWFVATDCGNGEIYIVGHVFADPENDVDSEYYTFEEITEEYAEELQKKILEIKGSGL